MKKSWLKPFAAGAAITSGAFLVSWFITQEREQREMLVLQYTRPGGPDRMIFEGKTDPLPAAENITDSAANDADIIEQVVQIVRKCGVATWVTESTIGQTDVHRMALARMPMEDVNLKSFNCLTSYVTPPYIRLYRESAQ